MRGHPDIIAASLGSKDGTNRQMGSFQLAPAAFRPLRLIRAPRSVKLQPMTRFSSTSSSTKNALKIVDGKAVLYRGPPAMANWAYFLFGGMFTGVGMQLAFTFYNHLTWPLNWRNPNNPPTLAPEWARKVAASLAGIVGCVTGFLFFSVPTKTITKLTLDTAKRELIIRTASREVSAFLPKIIYPRPFRTLAERHGYYRTDRINERIVPLSSVFRIRGSATMGALKPVERVDSRTRATIDERKCLELKVMDERSWYRLETAGGAQPPKGFGYAGFFRRLQHGLRGKTDWDGGKATAAAAAGGNHGTSPTTQQLGEKEPWFADRRTFDDIIPLVKRR